MLLLISILILAAVLRFWHFSTNPPSLYWDEVANGYNAYSILKTARDEYGNFMPLTFRAFNDYRPALAVYTLVPTIALFGLNEVGVRLPAIVLGVLSILLTYLLVKEFFRDEKIALTSSLFLAIAPWHINFTRAQFEASFMLFFSLLALFLFLKSFKNFKLLVLSSGFFALAINSYQGAKVWIPLFLAAIIFWYRKELLIFGTKLLLPLAILAASTMPIVLDFQNSIVRGKSVSIFNNNKHPKESFFSGYLSHYSPNFLFISGDSIGRHNVSGIGQLYVFEIPLILIGLFVLRRQKSRSKNFLLTWFLLAPIPAAISTPAPHALRAITFLPLWSIISAIGLIKLVNLRLKPAIKILLIFLLFSVGFYNVLTYLHLYYNHYPKEKALDWQDGYKEMVTYVGSVQNKYKSISITKYYDQPYIYVLFYLKYDPKKYQPQSEDKNKFDRFNFFPPNIDSGKNTLIISTEDVASTHNLLKQFKLRAGDVVFEAREP